MAQAEYDENMSRLRNYNRPFGAEGIREKDLQENVSAVGNRDDLPF